MTIRVTNSAAASLPASMAWSTTPTHGALWANGVPVDSGMFATAIMQPGAGGSVTFPAGTLQFDVSITDWNEPGAKEIFDAAVAAGTITWKVSLHDGDPGASYTANELTAAEAPGYTPGDGGRLTIMAEVQTV